MEPSFVKFDSETKSIIAGPQGGMQGQDGWVLYLPAKIADPRQPVAYEYVDELQAVIQMPAGDPVDTFSYAELRSQAYPKIGDQLDMLYHDIANNRLTERGDFYTALKAVKDTYPKP